MVLVLATLGVFVGPAAPACACSCAGGTESEAFAGADSVFVGVVAKVAEPWPSLSSADPVTVTFTVTEVFKATIPADVRVLTVSDGASCGYDFEPGARYLVFARADGDVWRTGLCDGNRVLTAQESVVLPGGHAPGPAIGGPDWSTTALIALIAVLVVAGGTGLWWRRRSRAQKSA